VWSSDFDRPGDGEHDGAVSERFEFVAYRFIERKHAPDRHVEYAAGGLNADVPGHVWIQAEPGLGRRIPDPPIRVRTDTSAVSVHLLMGQSIGTGPVDSLKSGSGTMRRLAIAALAAGMGVLGIEGLRAAPLTQQSSGLVVGVAGAVGGAILDVAINAGKFAEIHADAQGLGSVALDTDAIFDRFQDGFGTGAQFEDILNLANDGKIRVHVFVERCENGKIVRIRMTADGVTVPQDEGCDRTPVGFFWTDKARALRISLPTNLMQVDNRGMSTTRKAGIGAATVGGAVAILLGVSNDERGEDPITIDPGGPGTTFNPTGSYPSMTSVTNDPGEHRFFILLANNLVLTVTVSGGNMTITGPSGSNWVTVTGTYNSDTRMGVLTGSGTVAGFPNVGVRFEPTFTTTGAMSGSLTIGTGGELPGGQAATYSVMGQR
jgi:hypothetical protein